MEPITSLQNQRIKNAIKLRNQRDRKRQERFVIDGLREITRALTSDIRIDEVFYCPSLCESDEAAAMVGRLQESDCTLLPVNEKVWEKLTFGNRQDGLLVIAKTPERILSAIPLHDDSLIIILQAVEKPGNIGAVLRSADGAGATAIIVVDPVSDLFNPNAIRASLGTIFKIPMASCSTEEALAWIRKHDLTTFVATVGANIDYAQADYRQRCAIVLGSEAHGVTPEWQSSDLPAIGIPMRGVADSLNVSASAAVVLYEANRQRTG